MTTIDEDLERLEHEVAHAEAEADADWTTYEEAAARLCRLARDGGYREGRAARAARFAGRDVVYFRFVTADQPPRRSRHDDAGGVVCDA